LHFIKCNSNTGMETGTARMGALEDMLADPWGHPLSMPTEKFPE
jgi:hypothetical protein